MSTVSEQLRRGREQRNLTLQQVAEITKIRTDHVAALEEGDYNVFSAPVYVRGFVRTYATLLRLDTPRILSELDAELGKTEKFSEPPPLSEKSGGVIDSLMLAFARIDWRKGGLVVVAVVLVLGAMAAYTIVRHRRTHDPLSGLKPVLYNAPTQSISGEMLPLPGGSPRKK